MGLLQEIQEAKEDSDIHRIVKRVAHRLHLDNKYKHEKENWFYALEKVDTWLKEHLLMQGREDVHLVVKEAIHHYAKNIDRNDRYKPNSRLWLDAIDSMSELIYEK